MRSSILLVLLGALTVHAAVPARASEPPPRGASRAHVLPTGGVAAAIDAGGSRAPDARALVPSAPTAREVDSVEPRAAGSGLQARRSAAALPDGALRQEHQPERQDPGEPDGDEEIVIPVPPEDVPGASKRPRTTPRQQLPVTGSRSAMLALAGLALVALGGVARALARP